MRGDNHTLFCLSCSSPDRGISLLRTGILVTFLCQIFYQKHAPHAVHVMAPEYKTWLFVRSETFSLWNGHYVWLKFLLSLRS